MNRLPKVSSPLAVAAIIVLSSCGTGDSTSPATADAPLVEAVTPQAISGVVGAAANPTPVVRITDRRHKPLANVTVEFRLGRSGSLKTPTVTTDATGLASPGEWVFSIRAGPNELNVFVNHTYVLTFTATTKPDVIADLLASNHDLAGLPGQSVAGPRVQALDRFGNPVSNVVVSFAISAGGGTLQNTSAKTSIDGYASAGTWKLGDIPGTSEATASTSGIDPTVFVAHVLDPSTIKWYDLVAIKTESQEFTPTQMGVASARVGLTSFDPCLCKKQEGYFVDDVQYSYDGLTQIWTDSGPYLLDGKVLHLNDFGDPGGIDGKTLILPRQDYDYGITYSWVYKESDTK